MYKMVLFFILSLSIFLRISLFSSSENIDISLNNTVKNVVDKNSHGFKNISISLNNEEKTFLNKHLFRCETTSTWEPFNVYLNGRLQGISIDIWNIIKKVSGLKSKCNIVDSWSKVLEDIKYKKADITISTTITKERLKYAVFSKTYATFPIVVATRNDIGFIPDITSLKNKKIVVGENYTVYCYLKNEYKYLKLIEVKNTKEALKMVSEGKAYAAVDILPVVAYQISKYNFANLKISGKIDKDFDLKIMVSKEHKRLIPIINRAIDSITKEQKEVIFRKWINVKYQKGYEVKYLIAIISIAIVLLFVIAIWTIYLQSEIKKRKILEKELERLATMDRLTSIFNRYKMDVSLEKQIEIAKRYNRPFSLIFFDIDHFKNINDKYGHKVGDIILKELSDLVKKSLRKSDIFGRWGGEEFLIILPETTKKEAMILAEKIRVIIEKHKFSHIDGLTCSFGVSQFRKNDTHSKILLRVDKKLYSAKSKGRNKVIANL